MGERIDPIGPSESRSAPVWKVKWRGRSSDRQEREEREQRYAAQRKSAEGDSSQGRPPADDDGRPHIDVRA